MSQNGSKWVKMSQNESKWVKTESNWVKLSQIGQFWPNIQFGAKNAPGKTGGKKSILLGVLYKKGVKIPPKSPFSAKKETKKHGFFVSPAQPKKPKTLSAKWWGLGRIRVYIDYSLTSRLFPNVYHWAS